MSLTFIQTRFSIFKLKCFRYRWVKKFTPYVGACFSLGVGPDSMAKEITSISVEGKMNTYVWMHHPGQFTDYDSMAKVK